MRQNKLIIIIIILIMMIMMMMMMMMMIIIIMGQTGLLSRGEGSSSRRIKENSDIKPPRLAGRGRLGSLVVVKATNLVVDTRNYVAHEI